MTSDPSQLDMLFQNACSSGDMHQLRACLKKCDLMVDHSPWRHLKKIIRSMTGYLSPWRNPQDPLDKGFVMACRKNQLAVVTYLLNSGELVQHPDLHAWEDSALVNACQHGHMDIVKYILKLSADALYSQASEALITAFSYHQMHVVQFLLYDMNMCVKACLYDRMHPTSDPYQLRHLVQKRDMAFQLHSTLSDTPECPQRAKI